MWLWNYETQIVEFKVWEIGSYVSVPLPHPERSTCVIARVKGRGNHSKGGPGQKRLYWAAGSFSYTPGGAETSHQDVEKAASVIVFPLSVLYGETLCVCACVIL